MKKLILILLLSSTAFASKITCGTERWQVKTLTDNTAQQIIWEAKDITVGEILAKAAPETKPAGERLLGFETQLWRTHALFVGWKHEKDGDAHLVFADPDDVTKTFIGEVPRYECANPKYAQTFIGLARTILTFGKPHKSGQMLTFKKPIPVIIEGIGFFDFVHGQDGVAPSGVEFHPLFKLERDTEPPAKKTKQADGDKAVLLWWAAFT